MSDDRSAAAFVYAVSATCSHLAPSTGEDSQFRTHRIETLINKSIISLGSLTRQTSISVKTILTRVFLANSLVAVGDPRTAFLYLRQAASMLETYRLPSKITTELCDARLVRLYWLIFIHERYQCIAEYRTALLQPLPHAGPDGALADMAEHIGFSRIVSLFRLLDDIFIQYWLGEGGIAPPITSVWVQHKNEEFRQDEAEAATMLSSLDIAQQVDLHVTRHWLLVLVWRIAMANRLLGEDSSEHCLSLRYPLHVSARLLLLLQDIPSQAIEIHGVSIVQKLFELADTVADITMHASSSAPSEAELHHLRQLWDILSSYTQLDATRREIIDDKFRRIFAYDGAST